MANECIPYYSPGAEITTHNASGSTITGKRLVKCSAAPGTDGNVRVATAGVGDKADGVCLWDQVNGAKGAMLSEGVVPITSGAAVAAGDLLQSDSTGRVIPYDPPALSGNAEDLPTGPHIIGKAYTTVGAAGSDVKVRLSL